MERAAIKLYERFGFVQEGYGRERRQTRRGHASDPTPRRRVAALNRLLRQDPDFVFANAPPPFREPLVSLGQPPVTVVEARRPVVELLLAPFDTSYLRGRTFGLFCRLDLARLDLRDRLRQPNATFL